MPAHRGAQANEPLGGDRLFRDALAKLPPEQAEAR
jgi:hypothetical protein